MSKSQRQKAQDWVQELEARLAEAKRSVEEIEDDSEAQRVATELHARLCTLSHEDQCSWEYDDGSWTRDVRKRYLVKAERMLLVADEDTIVQIITLL